MSSLQADLLENIVNGLKRKTLNTCSRWAMAVRVMGKPFPGPWRFKYHPWLKEMHDCNAEFLVGKKGAQLGFSEAALNRMLFSIDVKKMDGMYVLPAKTPDATDFSSSRFNPALELSPHLASLFSDVQNIGHKRAGTVNLYIRGSKSRAGLKSVPVGFLVLDEVDEMDQDNIPLAFERQAGQLEKSAWAISTPTIPGFGIDGMYQDTTQEHFFFACPKCSRQTELIFPDCFVLVGESINDPRMSESYIQCKECKNKLPHELKYEWLADGQWVKTYPDRPARGFHVNQLYSSTVRPENIARAVILSNFDPAEEQELYNSKMGLAHTVDGAKISDEMIEKVIRDHKMGLSKGGKLITMGVDVGSWLHLVIEEWTQYKGTHLDLSYNMKPKTINITKVKDFEELDVLMQQYGVFYCVVDANPERRKASEFARRFYGRVKLCIYGRGVNSKQINIHRDVEMDHCITVDRTSWLDQSLGRIRAGTIDLPMDTPYEFKHHLKSLVRVYEKDVDDNPIGRYIKKSTDNDHYAHARNYSEIASILGLGASKNQDI